MSTVFITNQPMKYSREHESYTLAVDLRPAERFGKMIFLTEAGEPAEDGEWLPMMQELLRKFNPLTDYLLPVGHPMLIVAASAIVGAQGATSVRILRWSRSARDYTPQLIKLFTP